MLHRTINDVTTPLPRANPDGVSPIAQPEDGETKMTTETDSVLNTVKEAFAPVTDALKNLQNMEVPEVAREFVKKTAGTAKERAADLHAGSEKVTAAIETAVAGSVTEAAKISRNIQQALYQDAEAFFSGIDRLASAKSFNEAVAIQSEMIRARGELLVSRAKSSTEYLGKLVAEGAKTAQDNLAKVYTKTA
jgi:phasin